MGDFRKQIEGLVGELRSEQTSSDVVTGEPAPEVYEEGHRDGREWASRRLEHILGESEEVGP